MNFPKTLPDALAQIRRDLGAETLKNPEKILAVFADIAPNLKAERIQLEMLVKSGCAKKLAAAAEASAADVRSSMASAVDTLCQDYLMDAKKAEDLCGIYVTALGGKLTEETPVPPPKPQPEEEKKPAQTPVAPPQPKPQEPKKSGFFFHVEDRFTIRDRGQVVTGWVQGAPISVGDTVTIVRADGTTRNAVIGGIEHYKELYDTMEPGRAVGLLLNGLNSTEVSAGDKLIAADAAVQPVAAPPKPRQEVKKGGGFHFTVENLFPVTNRGIVVTGWVQGAPISVGDTVTVVRADGTSYNAVIGGIEHYHKLYDSIAPGKAVGLLLNNLQWSDVASGDKLISAK